MFNIDDSCIKVVEEVLKKKDTEIRQDMINDGFYYKEMNCSCCKREIIIEGEYRGENYDMLVEVNYA